VNRTHPWSIIGTVCTLALVAALTGCGSNASTTAENPLQSGLVSQVSGAGATPYLEALQHIADQNGGNRASLQPGYEASVDYVVGVLRAAGYQVSTPTYEVSTSRRSGTKTRLRNVVAQTSTGDAARVVMLGAHLDSVVDGPGINDNGSGVATLLEIATKLGASPPVRNAVRFAFWGSEEKGLVGSTYYVDTLSSAERSKIMFYLNLDMTASSNGGYFVQGGQGRSSSRSGPPGSGRVGEVLVDQFTKAGVTAQTVPFDGGSDYEPFIDAGIPSGGVLAGDSDRKSSEQAASWGGQAGVRFDPCYHSACDRIDNINPVILDHSADATAGTIGYFVMSEQALTG
jgi:aminopeptidase S